MSTDPSPVEAPLPGRMIAFRADRLGARLVSLMNAMRMAQDFNAGFACAWTDTTGVGEAFNDPCELFKPGFVKHYFLDAEEWRAHRPDCEALTGQLQREPETVAEALATGQDLIVGNAFGIICLADEDREEVTRRFQAQFSRIRFSQPVTQAMHAVEDALAGFTGYHIRRGDLTGDLKAMNKAWPHKVVPNEFYEVHMRRTLTEGAGGVAVFSDDADTIAHYRALFPSMRTLPDLIDTGSLTEAQRDLVELYAMSRCATIIAPQRSAFSSTAAELSGAQKKGVMDCLSDADRRDAQQALFERLRDRPERFSGQGEIGQCLAHVGQWLEEEERWEEAASLFARRVAEGLNISFIYPRTMSYLHRVGRIDSVIDTAEQMRSRSVVHVKDQAAAEILHGYAYLRRDAQAISQDDMAAPDAPAIPDASARQTGLRHIVNGFWHAPTVPAARSVVPFLVENGLLHAENFLPSTLLQRGLQTRRGPLKAMFQEFPDLITMPGMIIPQAVGSMDPVLLDWAPLMRSFSEAAEVRRGTVARFADAVRNAEDDPSTEIERASMLALFRSFGEGTEAAIEELEALAARSPENAMVHQRLSHAQRIARKFGKAAESAARAVELAPEWPVMQAWAGMSLIRGRDYDRAVEHLRIAAEPRIGVPSIHALLAEALQRLGDELGALAQIQTALDLAPLEVEYTLRIARILDHLERPEEAIARLLPVVEVERAPAKLFILLIELLEKTGDTAEATAMVREAQRRSPDHPTITDLAERLAA